MAKESGEAAKHFAADISLVLQTPRQTPMHWRRELADAVDNARANWHVGFSLVKTLPPAKQAQYECVARAFGAQIPEGIYSITRDGKQITFTYLLCE
jgi:hypothetical protein